MVNVFWRLLSEEMHVYTNKSLSRICVAAATGFRGNKSKSASIGIASGTSPPPVISPCLACEARGPPDEYDVLGGRSNIHIVMFLW